VSLALGIDTGGTYTDGALVDLGRGEVVATSKARTTHQDLSLGVATCLEALGADWKKVKMISVSTTLATNSIVEGKGGRVGLILIGRELDGASPAAETVRVQGGHNNAGEALSPVLLEELDKAWRRLGGKVDAFAVSGYMSIRNPEHELLVREFLRKRTRKPVVCAHQLSRELGFYERSITAAFNAKILPVVNDLFDALQEVMSGLGIHAPIMVVKGDGTLLPLELARDFPVETVLSGPAASVIGGCFLARVEEAIVVDMGGTTTDVAVVNKGYLTHKTDEATVGGWRLKVKTVHVNTVGFGGDSHIQFRDGHFRFGPRRVIPLSWAAVNYPEIVTELEAIFASRYWSRSYQPYDFFILEKKVADFPLANQDLRIVAALSHGPCSARQIAERLETVPGLLNLEGLEGSGIIRRISLTPTDLLHVKGSFVAWNRPAATMAVRILAAVSSISEDYLVSFLLREFERQLARNMLVRLLAEELETSFPNEDKVMERLIQRLLGETGEKELKLELALIKPLVAVGAPVQAYFPSLARRLGASLVIPEHREVANAVGAAVAPVVKEVEVLVRPARRSFSVHSSRMRTEYASLSEAILAAEEMAQDEVVEFFRQLGIDNPEVRVEKREEVVPVATEGGGRGSVFLEARILAVGKGYGGISSSHSW